MLERWDPSFCNETLLESKKMDTRRLFQDEHANFWYIFVWFGAFSCFYGSVGGDIRQMGRWWDGSWEGSWYEHAETSNILIEL